MKLKEKKELESKIISLLTNYTTREIANMLDIKIWRVRHIKNKHTNPEKYEKYCAENREKWKEYARNQYARFKTLLNPPVKIIAGDPKRLNVRIDENGRGYICYKRELRRTYGDYKNAIAYFESLKANQYE